MPLANNKALYLAISLALAGSAVPQLSIAERSNLSLEEIVVTARKRSESLMDAPVAITAVSGEAMEKQGITNLEQLNAKVPGLQMGRGPAVPSIYIRGVGSGINKGFEQSVGLYIDGIYQSRSDQFTQSQFDLQQVEVLRGPQGTLFGKNTIAGAIKIESRNPEVGEEFGGSLAVAIEPKYGTQRYTGVFSGGLTDTLAARLAIRDDSSDGYVKNKAYNEDAAQRDVQLARLTLSWEPTDDLSITPKVSYTDSEVVGTETVNPIYNPDLVAQYAAAGLTNSILGSLPVLAGLNPDFYPSSGSNSYYSFVGNTVFHPEMEDGEFHSTEMLNSSINVEWEVGDYTLTALSAYVDYDKFRSADGATNPTNLAQNHEPETLKMFSQELRVASNLEGPVNFIAGIYLEDQKLDNQFRTTFDGTLGGLASSVAGVPSVFAVPGMGSIDYATIVNDFSQETETLALFGEFSIELTDDLTLDLGVRYSEDEKSASRLVRYAAGHPLDLDILVTPDIANIADAPRDDAAAAGAAVGANLMNVLANAGTDAAVLYGVLGGGFANYPSDNQGRRTEYHFDPSIKLRWEYSEDGMMYLSYSEGYKSGGFNQSSDTTSVGGVPDPRFGHEFEDEGVEAWELGIKQSFMDGRGRFGATLYRSELTDLQVTSWQGISFIVTNAAEVVAQGVELEAQYLLTENLEIGGSIAYLDHEITSYPDAPCDAQETVDHVLAGNPGSCLDDFGGQRGAFAPKYSGTAYANYTYNLSDWELVANLSANFKDEMYLNPDLDPVSLQDSYVKVDARLGLNSADGVWEFLLYGRNLTDETTYTYQFGAPFATGIYSGFIEEPRVLGLQGKFNF